MHIAVKSGHPIVQNNGFVPTGRPRIGGTAVVGGVHLSTPSFGTASFWQLVVTGLALMAMGGTSLGLSYVVLWTIGQVTAFPLVEVQFQMAGPAAATSYVACQILVNLVSFFLFLLVVRLTPLAAYHGAEHKVVHAIELYGYPTREMVREMPRVHPRCGTTLLAGILPAFLVAAPLLLVAPALAVVVVLLGWTFRYPVGALIQQHLTTKEPSDKQLAAGLQAGRQLLDNWYRNPHTDLSPLVSLWHRGFIQLIAGVLIGSQLLGWAYQHLHIWLDWELWLR